ncbi:phospholipase D family protein [Microbacterium sp. SD291]|uniref:phospholipase D family protein n=1 Tax=Microbacterium sp. SD291 TaxID=2782007 RepID=UPI001A95FC5B|nr:phospholipase D family protein [Microbacterium sp. SD291]MBO0981967.1 phospholipase D family protein [Microbacterium sp. SD291]
MRRAVDRIDVFAQAGYIGLGAASDLVAVLEPMIHPVMMPPGRLFHPKVWFLEFAAGGERRYRFICSSRNLTNDRTWDAVVALDGVPGDSDDESTLRANDGMVRLLHWLAAESRTAPRLTSDRRARIDELAESWKTIRWEYPEHVRRLAVHVLGIGADSTPKLGGLQALVVSPFVTDEGLSGLRARRGGETTLISRPEQLDRLNPPSFDGLSMRILDDFVDQALADAGAGEAVATGLSGLHAKMIAHDHAHLQSTLLAGSANATGPAWTRNVEVMIELGGSTKQFGVTALAESLAPLLEEYATDGGATASDDETAERNLESALRTIATARLVLRVHQGDSYAYSLWAHDPAPTIPEGLSLSWRLLTQSDTVPGAFPPQDSPFSSRPVSLAEITPFVVVVLEDHAGRRVQTIMVAEILDDVPERQDAIVAAHLTEPGAFARFIRLMLQQPGASTSTAGGSFASFRSAFGGGVAEDGSGLLELLVRAAAMNQSALADIERVLSHLRPDERDSALPPGFSEVWAAVIGAIGTEAVDGR